MTSQAPQTPSLTQSVIATLATRFAVLPLGLLQGALLARGLGPSGLGRYSAVLVDVNLLTTLLALGLPGGLAVLVGQAQGNATTTRRLWRYGLWHIALALTVTLGIGLLLGRLLPTWLGPLVHGRTPLVLVLLGVCVCGQLGRDLHNALLWGGQRFSAQNRLSLLITVAQLAAVVVLFALHRLGVASALVLQALSLWSFSLLFLWRLRNWMRIPSQISQPDSEPTSTVRQLYAISVRNFLHILPDMLLFRIDVYLLEWLLPSASMEHELGLYQAGVRVAELLLMLPGTLNAVLFAKAAAKEDVAEQALLGAKLGLYLGLLGCLAMLLVGKPLLVLFYGSRFAGSFVPCLLVLLGCAALSFSGPLAGTLSGVRGYPPSVIWAQSLALLTNVGLNLWLLPRYGIVGAAMASTGAYTVSALCITTAFARHFGIPLKTLLIPVGPKQIWTRLRQR